MRHLSRDANALAQRGVRVNRLAYIHRVGTHLNGQRNLANHVARVRADHAAAQDLAVAVGLG
jgi:ethanolamine ammonia-lyase small subunit